jgi:putative transposase
MRQMGISELNKLNVLLDENGRLKKLAADLTLDKHILQEVLAKKV